MYSNQFGETRRGRAPPRFRANQIFPLIFARDLINISCAPFPLARPVLVAVIAAAAAPSPRLLSFRLFHNFPTCRVGSEPLKPVIRYRSRMLSYRKWIILQQRVQPDTETSHRIFTLFFFCLSVQETIELLDILSKKAPLLETLRFSSMLPISEYHKHLGKLKKLRYLVRDNLCYEDGRKVNSSSWNHLCFSSGHKFVNVFPKSIYCLQSEEYVKLFDVCPSLTHIVNDVGWETYSTFYHRWSKSFAFSSDTCPDSLCRTLNIPANDTK